MLVHADVSGGLMRQVARRLEADGTAVARAEGGLAWRAEGHGQSLRAELAAVTEGVALRAVVRTDCGPGGGDRGGRRAGTLDEATTAGMSAVVPGVPGVSRLGLVSVLRLPAGEEPGAVDFVLRLARLQAWYATRLVGGAPSGPPAPRDAADRSWPISWPAEMAECFARLSTVPEARVLAVGGGLMARRAGPKAREADGGLLVVAPKYRCDRAGTGLLVSIAAPWPGTLQDAIALNQGECVDPKESEVLGGWTVQRGELRYSSFCPEWAYLPGLAARLACAAAARLGWAVSREDGTRVVTSSRWSGTRGWSAPLSALLPSRG